ncbi:hypothetical protein [Arsenophonus nasoniae]|uniref:Uncharacterized protein n=1 Tax=Arsenophonus nasoniae TaxID=638 RepID=A0AA95JZJ3_9GAMM|nr:hypothetical protein [Arsenophonus nasoniae]WGL93781.1 hypothetical protein QE207_00530 [Arsenophonus nasoniae]WGL96007.1 hypothetical protein QE207_05315 [Arsenophonus nasoniae]
MNKLFKVFMTLFFIVTSYFSVANPTDAFPRCTYKPGKVCCIDENGQERCIP